jgi:uncharacterized phage-associated protein
MKYNAVIVANEFIKIAIDKSKPITQITLFKLLYFVNAAYLVIYGNRLVKEDFYAWKFGPVIPELYEITRKYRQNPIEQYIHKGNELDNDKNAIVCIQSIYNYFADYSPFSLVEITHSIGGAWSKVYYSQDSRGIIKDEDIKDEYKDKFSKK